MPHIQKHLRSQAARVPLIAAELNYAVSMLNLDTEKTFGDVETAVRLKVDDYVTRRGQITYCTINEIMGVLGAAAAEAERHGISGDVLVDVAQSWYDDVAAPYEEMKAAVNGDIYE